MGTCTSGSVKVPSLFTLEDEVGLVDSMDRHSVSGWWGGETLLEYYRYAPGPAAELPKHSHEEYQLGYSVDFPGEYSYRGARYTVPVESLTVIHPGETHSARDPMDRLAPATYRMMYVSPGIFEQIASEISGGRGKTSPGLPTFHEPVFRDTALARSFVRLHEVTQAGTSRLEQETRLLAVLAGFLERHADSTGSGYPRTPTRKDHRAVSAVREYLQDNYRANVSLGDLSSVANLSPFHLSRVFAEAVGISPHAYLIAMRVHRAKDLLLRGWPIAQAARDVGFSDQSHFSNYFKRFIGVSPGSYVKNSKILQ